MSSEFVHLDLSQIYSPHILSPHIRAYPKTSKGDFTRTTVILYGFGIHTSEIPDEIMKSSGIKIKDNDATLFCASRKPFDLVSDKGNLNTILLCAEQARLNANELFLGIPVSARFRLTTVNIAGKDIPKLVPVAIKVNEDDLIRRYNEMCAQYVTGG